MIQPAHSRVFECISAVQGLRKLRLLEVVLPFASPLFYQQRFRRSGMKEHATAVLGDIRGHAKVFKMITLCGSYRFLWTREIEIQTVTVP